ncbi:hypothetical protein EWB00_009993 [Schistosoma japonicum]|uniref:Uncharacterized protein n=1 Tax=Schistosoma japonicum TaxID=6182 RepID=A0A4Z2CL70_SCHJA|nr:hypothetical protein EWB00_009993 [Schistosoma japonicum]
MDNYIALPVYDDMGTSHTDDNGNSLLITTPVMHSIRRSPKRGPFLRRNKGQALSESSMPEQSGLDFD